MLVGRAFLIAALVLLPLARAAAQVPFAYPDPPLPQPADYGAWQEPGWEQPVWQEPVWQEPASSCLLPCEPLEANFCSRPDCALGSATLDVLLLDRTSRPQSHNILFVGTLGSPVANARELSMGTDSGIRFDLIVPSRCGCDLNLNVFATHDFDTLRTVNDPDPADADPLFWLFFDTVPATPAAGYTVQYDSDLTSFELNIRTRQCRRLTLLAGLRIFELEEQFNIFDAGTNNGVRSTTDNELYGVQFGLQGLLMQWGRWRLETSLKAGAYHNDIDLQVIESNFQLDAQLSHVAFLGDMQLTAIYQVGPRLLLRVGYQGFWLEGVGLAPDQSDNASLPSGLVSVDLREVIYQGGFVGAEATY